MNNKVSIIIPSYGSNTNPCRAIDSVLKQSYQDLEVIVVDDNGRNTEQQKTNEKAFEKYKNEKRFSYVIHEINKGGSEARNTGVRASSGDYLCFLDDDDFFSDREKINKQMSVNRGLDDKWAGSYSSLHKYLGDKPIRAIPARKSGNILVDVINDKTSIGTAAPIIRKECFEAIGGFDESFKRHQDWEFFARLSDKYKMMAVESAYYDRCYKPDVNRRSIDDRIDNMNRYTNKMEAELKSIPKSKIKRLMKKKYIAIIFALIREKRMKQALGLMKEKRFTLLEYMDMIGFVFLYLANRIKYGSHF